MIDISNQLMILLQNFISLFIVSAPWLLLGFCMAALIKALVNIDVMYKHLGGNSVWVTVKAAVIGAPLPLCSCGVVPAALGLRAAGASKNATVSFLVATPETGVDSVSFTYALMGPVMAIIRPIAAVMSAIVAGILVGKSEQLQDQQLEQVNQEEKKGVESTCCESSACSTTKPVKQASQELPLLERLRGGFEFAFGKMLRDVINWLVIGLLVAAMVQTFLPEHFFDGLGDGFLSMLLMAVIGVPMYVCATASTPIAAGFLLAGLSPGAVLVFMLVGPASNIGTLMIVRKELGQRAVLAYLIGIVVTAFAFGFLVNYLSSYFGWDFTQRVLFHDRESVSLLSVLSALLLAVFMLKALWQSNRPLILRYTTINP